MARRSNQEQNRRTMFFSARVSIYLTYLLSRTRTTANQVTYAFAVVGAVAAAVNYLPTVWAPLLGFILYRTHVILDVVDGELARYRKTSSPVGAYLDFMTHYAVYATAAFGLGAHHYLTTGQVESLFFGFAVAIGLVMNLASKDCWYRANFGGGNSVEGDHPMWSHALPTLLAAKACSVNTVWFLYAAAAAAGGLVHDTIGGGSGRDAAWMVLAVYACALPAFSLLRIGVTVRHRRIPRRAAWY